VADDPQQLQFPAAAADIASAVARAFDPARLTQARLLAGMTKQALATSLDVSPAAIGQFEAGVSKPRADHLPKLASRLRVPVSFFAAGRPHARVDAGVAHFRSLRSTRVAERAKALAYVEQVWELVNALDRHVELPEPRLPPTSELAVQGPAAAATGLRRFWRISPGPFQHLVRTMEVHGILVTLLPFAQDETARIDAFSTSRLPRPIVVLTPDRANNIYRHRFTAAHELGHLLLHHDIATGDQKKEREASAFAAELLAPAAQIRPELHPRLPIHELTRVSQRWGISVKALITRSRELGIVSETSARRAYQRLSQLESTGLIPAEPITSYAGETPCLLGRAYDLAEQHGLTIPGLAAELAWPVSRVHELLGDVNPRPTLRLV
jgi:Zn-dependent peptidase ImmA (M78 family)/DNA-binding XRE family transcriptional regulator